MITSLWGDQTKQGEVLSMSIARGYRFSVPFDDVFPQGLFLVGEIQPMTEYQSQEDRARNRPVRPRIDEVTGKHLYRATCVDPSAEKDREKSVSVEFACDHQPVPPEPIPGLPLRPVVLEGLTVLPRAESSGQAKWVTWVFRATGMKAPAAPAPAKSSGRQGSGEQTGKTAA